jgi:single-strand selective monofunctional uracil DNA glycosylase
MDRGSCSTPRGHEHAVHEARDRVKFLDELNRALAPLTFADPVHTIYNPLIYARGAYEDYWHRYATGQKSVLFMGMNPGPWGMAQTGIPFGEVSTVRDWLKIEAPIGKPVPEHPARPIQGLACPRTEVSGQRIWGWIRRRFGTPEEFFRNHFIANYCPLVFMEESGRNRTPDKLPKHEREPLFAACDRALQETARILKPKAIVAVGKFAEGRARIALPSLPIVTIPHPSPANPAANRGWEEEVERRLGEAGLL